MLHYITCTPILVKPQVETHEPHANYLQEPDCVGWKAHQTACQQQRQCRWGWRTAQAREAWEATKDWQPSKGETQQGSKSEDTGAGSKNCYLAFNHVVSPTGVAVANPCQKTKAMQTASESILEAKSFLSALVEWFKNIKLNSACYMRLEPCASEGWCVQFPAPAFVSHLWWWSQPEARSNARVRSQGHGGACGCHGDSAICSWG